jgi:hypothetical protein
LDKLERFHITDRPPVKIFHDGCQENRHRFASSIAEESHGLYNRWDAWGATARIIVQF